MYQLLLKNNTFNLGMLFMFAIFCLLLYLIFHIFTTFQAVNTFEVVIESMRHLQNKTQP